MFGMWQKIDRLPAVSRVDNKTTICDNCGAKEVLVGVPYGISAALERMTKPAELCIYEACAMCRRASSADG